MTVIEAVRNNDLSVPPTTTFANLWHLWDFIEAPTPSPQQQKHPAWRRITKYVLSPGLLLARWESPDTLIGVSFDNKTHYCLLDLDRLSQYYPDLDETSFALILASLEAIGLVRPLLLRSSSSGGLHIYYPLPEPVSTWKLANLLANTLQDAGFTLKGGHLEAFPNVKTWVPEGQGFSHYQAHRLPLQQGSVLLDRDLIPEGADLNRFMTQWQWCAQGQDSKRLTQSLDRAKPRHNTPDPKGSALEYLQDLEIGINRGWTGPAETNKLLSLIARLGYIFRHLTGQALADFIANTARQLPGYQAYCGHQHDLDKRSRDWARTIEKSHRYYPYKEKSAGRARNQVRKALSNAEKRAQAIARLKQAVRQLEMEGTLAPTITARANQLASLGFSQQTLYRSVYRPFWHPAQYEPCVIPEPISLSEISPPDLQKAKSPQTLSEQEITDQLLRSVRPSDVEKRIEKTPIRGGQGGGTTILKPLPSPVCASPETLVLAEMVVLAGGRGYDLFKKLLCRTSLEKARQALEAFREQSSRTEITNPLAFIVSALRKGWVPNCLERGLPSSPRSPVSLPSDPIAAEPSVDPNVGDETPSVSMPEWFREQLKHLQGKGERTSRSSP